VERFRKNCEAQQRGATFMRKLSVGLLAAVVIALAVAPADAAKKKKSGKKAKAEVSKTEPIYSPLGGLSCFLSGMAGTKSPGPGCGR
jgi:hypothetical protein